MKRFFILPTIIFMFVFFVGCGRNGESDNLPPDLPDMHVEAPLLWRATSPENGQIMYLFGTIHAGDASIYPLPDFIMDAFNRSDYLAVEVNLYNLINDPVAAMEMALMMMYTDGRTITDELGEELHAAAVEVITEFDGFEGMPAEVFDIMKPAFWFQILVDIAVEEAGLSSEYGLDLYFIMAAMERGIEILEVESVKSQMEMLTGFSPELNAFLIEGSLDIPFAAQALKELYAAWQRGDENLIEAMLEYEYSDMPEELAREYIDAILINRDIEMTRVARSFMAEGRTVFFAVGLAHLVGDDSVIYLLRQAGYKIERIVPQN